MRLPLPIARATLGLAALLGPATRAAAAPLFASPPHFLSLGDRQRIVLFLNERVEGALAAPMGGGAYDVVVPGSAVDPEIVGTVFHGDDAPPHPRITTFVVRPNRSGGTTIHLETARAVGAVDAVCDDDPPRLVIDVTPPSASAKKAAAAVRAVASGGASTAAPHKSDGPAVARAAPASDAAPRTPTPARDAGDPPPLHPQPVTGEPLALGPVAVRVAAALASPRPEPTTSPRRGNAVAPPVGPPVTTAGSATAPRTAARDTIDARMPCRLRRVRGVPFCAPDPAVPAYAAPPETAQLAAAVATGAPEDELPPALAGDDAAALYLAADRELVARAASRRLLSAVDLYRRALRRFPGFVDAPRARVNVALAYRTVGFRGELAAAADAAAGDPGAALAFAAAGDLALEDDDLDTARAWYDRAERAGAAGACLGARGRAAIASRRGDAVALAREAGHFAALCAADLLHDPDTDRIAARARIAAGDAQAAVAILGRVRQALGPNGAALVMEDTAFAAAEAGDEATARHLYEQIAAGLAGGAAARRATIALARMDAAHGDVGGGMRRLESLHDADTGNERDALARTAIVRALDAGAPSDAIALVHEHGVDPSGLATADQLRLAAAYRTAGLPGESDRLLDHVRATLGDAAPDGVWEERGRAALAEGDAPRALAVGDDWLRLRGHGDPGPAQALRAQALAVLGNAAGARAALAIAVGTLEADAVRALRRDVATSLRTVDPAAARDVFADALAAPNAARVPAAETATLLRGLADAAEAAGDDAAAVRALDALVREHANDPSAAGAGYRLARLRAGEGGRDAKRAYHGAPAQDALEKRVVAAGEAYETIVTPFERPLPASLASGPDPTAAVSGAPNVPTETVPHDAVPAAPAHDASRTGAPAARARAGGAGAARAAAGPRTASAAPSAPPGAR